MHFVLFLLFKTIMSCLVYSLLKAQLFGTISSAGIFKYISATSLASALGQQNGEFQPARHGTSQNDSLRAPSVSIVRYDGAGRYERSGTRSEVGRKLFEGSLLETLENEPCPAGFDKRNKQGLATTTGCGSIGRKLNRRPSK